MRPRICHFVQRTDWRGSDETAPQLGPAPDFGQHTEELLLELGYDWDLIIELKVAGAIN